MITLARESERRSHTNGSSTRGWKCAVGVDLRAVGYQSPMGALLPRVRLAGRRSTIVVAALGSAGVLALAACGGGDDSTGLGVPDGAPPELTAQRAEWPAPNGDLQNTRVATSSEISAANVATLGIAWRAPITAKGTFGGYASTPIISDGVVYTQDLSSNVAAYSLESGKELWKRSYDSPTVGPNGLALGYGKVFGATADTAFALDARSGKEVWRSQRLTRNANEGIDMAPGVFDGNVFVSTVPGNAKSFYKGNGQGVLWALDAETGEKNWTFETVPADLWDPAHTAINSGGGLWHPPAIDSNGKMFIAIANPAPWPGTKQYPWAKSRPGPNPDTNSLVSIDPDTGTPRWTFQALPHDIYDWDLQLPPMVAYDGDQELVLVSGKLGWVFAVNAGTGELVWKTSVGQHNGHDADHLLAAEGKYDELPRFPLTILPGILGGVETQMAVADGVIYAPIVNLPTTFKSQVEPVLEFAKGTGEMVALDLATGAVRWATTLPQPAYGAATVSKDLVFTTTFDGKVIAFDRATGAIRWQGQLPAGTNATVAIVGDTLITAASYPQTKTQKAEIIALRLGAGQPLASGSPSADQTGGGSTSGPPDQGGGSSSSGGSGTATAAQLAGGQKVFTANCGGCHTLADAGTSGSVGPNLDQLEPAADTVARQVENGGGGMPAFADQLSKQEIENVAAYVAAKADKNAKSSGSGSGP